MFLLFGLVLGLGSGCANQPTQLDLGSSSKAVDLSGNWEVDFKRTENAQEKLLFLYEVARSQLRQQSSRRDTSNNVGGRQMVQQSIEDLNDLIKLGSLADTMNQSNVLRIEQGEGYVLVKRDDDFALNCELGAEVPPLVSGQEWCGFDKNGKLIFISRLPKGLDIVHEFLLSADTSRLNVATTVKTPALRDAYTVNRVYMPFDAGIGLYNCEFTLKKKKSCSLGASELSEGGEN